MSNSLKIAINGFGRIGRCVLRTIFERNLNIEVIAINEPSDLDSMVYLTQFDSTHGLFPGTVKAKDNSLYINNKKIQVFHETDPKNVNWAGLGIEMLLECSGHYLTRDNIEKFTLAGCKRVLLSNPGKNAEEIDSTIVFGVNEANINNQHRIVSAASCTTNAVVPVLNLLSKKFGVESAFMTTLHSVMNDQPIIDGYHDKDLRKTRSAMQSMIPINTGLAHGVERILPELKGLTSAKSVRVPIVNVSAIDLSVNITGKTSQNELIELFQQASSNQDRIFSCVQQAFASTDFNHNSHSSIIDTSQIRVNRGNFINMMIWFDNEWGFANRMIDVAQYWANLIKFD